MKSTTILEKIRNDGTVSLHKVDLLNKALKREKKIREKESVRFIPLLSKFDIVNADYCKYGVTNQYSPLMTFTDLYNMFVD